MVNDPVEVYLHNFSSEIRADVPKHVRFFFRAYDAPALHAHLVARGQPVSELNRTDYDALEFSLTGPEGYRLVFLQFF